MKEASKSNKAHLVNNLKVGTLGGRTTLLAKGRDTSINSPIGMRCGNDDSLTIFYWQGTPAVNIPLESPSFGWTETL